MSLEILFSIVIRGHILFIINFSKMIKKSIFVWIAASLFSISYATEIVSMTWNVQVTWDETAPNITVTSDQWDSTNSVSWSNTWFVQNVDSVELESPCVWDSCNWSWDVSASTMDSSATVSSESMAATNPANWTWTAMNTENIGNIKVWPQTTYMVLWLIMLIALFAILKLKADSKK